ncbi:hypothetical protein PHLCEN_2v12253 [Hermanssonia centrifuga]|uniref:Uncharacterized protein n=1 Tax=Hermanssonia centrifuga TaxID=98765 RepID=A0A2R6NHY8_9APHY|nr:hypothetical protein PHLCEN_2v12253 [Hermanssonia centrifuga]
MFGERVRRQGSVGYRSVRHPESLKVVRQSRKDKREEQRCGGLQGMGPSHPDKPDSPSSPFSAAQCATSPQLEISNNAQQTNDDNRKDA